MWFIFLMGVLAAPLPPHTNPSLPTATTTAHLMEDDAWLYCDEVLDPEIDTSKPFVVPVEELYQQRRKHSKAYRRFLKKHVLSH